MAEKTKRGPGRPPGSKNKKTENTKTSRNTGGESSYMNKEDHLREFQAQVEREKRKFDVIWAITFIALGIFLGVTIWKNTTGALGATIHDISLGLFGAIAYVMPVIVILFGILLLLQKLQHLNGVTACFSVLGILQICILNSARFILDKSPKFGFSDIVIYYKDGVAGKGGGAFGMELGSILVKTLGKPGLYIFSLAVLVIAIFLVANTPIARFFDKVSTKRENRRLLAQLNEAERDKVSSAVAGNVMPGTDPVTGEFTGHQMDIYEADRINRERNEQSAVKPSMFAGLSKLWGGRKDVPAQNENPAPAVQIQEPAPAVQIQEPAPVASMSTEIPQVPPVVTPAPSVEPIPEPLNVDVEKPAERKRFTLFGRGKSVEPAKPDYNSDDVVFGKDSFKRRTATGYGLGDMSDFGHSGSYGLSNEDTSYTRRGSGYGLDGSSSKSYGTGLEASEIIEPGKGLEGGNTSRAGSNVSSIRNSSRNTSGSRNSAGVNTAPGVMAATAAAAAATAAASIADASEETAVSAALKNRHQQQESKEQKDEKPVNFADKKVSDEELAEFGDALEESLAATAETEKKIRYELPPVTLLKEGKGNRATHSQEDLERKAAALTETLKNFGVIATVTSVTQGASVTRYEIQPATGVKVSSITRLTDDIALNMRAKSIRIEAPIPGKAAVGIEVENDKPSPVVVRELIDSPEFKAAESKISFVVGKDISGNNIIANLHDMPHLLIAGATGSGKSVCVNTIITSFLYKASPDDLKLIMVDPKVVELAIYNDLPHMLVPVVTDPRKAAKALARAVKEMDDRYDRFAEARVKDLVSYNNKFPEKRLPEIVIIIDELADLMMAASNEVENSICRLAQKARAAGMHLIVATQRPSVDVVTGLIKANIPSRIAFSVSSQFDSRTIIDTAGAEKLLGKGDMLFSPVGSTKPYRVQGPFISDTESGRVVDYWAKYGKPVADEAFVNAMEGTENSESQDDEPQDALTEEAIAFILKSKQASVSMLQRRFRIGYNRAARIIDEIEAKGIIGPSDGSRPRQVLITEDEYYRTEEPQEDVDDSQPETEELVYEPVEDSVSEMVDITDINDISDSAIDSFNSLPESVRKELMNTD